MSPVDVTISGLVFDIVGVLLIGKRFYLLGHILMAQATTYFGGDQALFGALEEQRHDGKTGLVFLIVGFTLQIIGTLGLSLNGWLLATPGILGVSLLMWHIFRGKSLRRTRPRRFSAHIERSATVQRAQQKADRASRDR